VRRSDAAKAVRDPATSVVRRIDAGCSPVRVVVSPEGRVVWVTARGSNALVAFDERALVDGAAATPIAVVPVGAAPVGLHFLRHGTLLAVANSNRFAEPSSPQTISFVDVAKGLAGASDALVGTVAAGAFPRELVSSRDGSKLYVTNFGSASVEVVPIAALRSG
jgi:DNA-binding beta-propeller fold protein YncE